MDAVEEEEPAQMISSQPEQLLIEEENEVLMAQRELDGIDSFRPLNENLKVIDHYDKGQEELDQADDFLDLQDQDDNLFTLRPNNNEDPSPAIECSSSKLISQDERNSSTNLLHLSVTDVEEGIDRDIEPMKQKQWEGEEIELQMQAAQVLIIDDEPMNRLAIDA